MSDILTFKVDKDLRPSGYKFRSSDALSCYRSSITGPIQGYCQQAFLQNILTAYRHDLPICLSPDDIWLLICQGFAQHVNFNAEELRSLFVDFVLFFIINGLVVFIF